MRKLFALSGKSTGGVFASALLAMSFVTAAHASTTISGTPITSVAENRYYGFQAWATDTDHRTVTYVIVNKPSWATFDTKYGHLYGIPTAANVGTYKNISIYATDGVSSGYLPPFSITVTGTGSTGGSTGTTGSATINWAAPTQNTNGSAVTNLAGYTISYGNTPTSLTSSVNITNASLTRYVIDGLKAGTYYFAVSAYNTSGARSSLSGVATKVIK